MVGPAAAIERTASSFMGTLKEQPLSLALVVMNFLLVAYLFYAGSQQLDQRADAMKMMVEWSKDTDKILGNCVSIDVMKLVVDLLERDRELYRRMLPALPGASPVAPPATPSPVVPLPQKTEP